jgi:hypothetical protein
MYTKTTNNHSSYGKSGSAALAIHTFLNTCELTLARREQHDGRETLIFSFHSHAPARNLPPTKNTLPSSQVRFGSTHRIGS